MKLQMQVHAIVVEVQNHQQVRRDRSIMRIILSNCQELILIEIQALLQILPKLIIQAIIYTELQV